MTCEHKTEYTYWGKVYNDWTGEYDDELITKTEHHTEDIGVGAFRCTQCKEVMYYTGSWKKFYTEGVPCPSSEYSERTGDVHKVRAAIKEQK
jgi:hypothetical protein